jgi:prepilin-type N-terminal cleavage/methylation domain-containing protein
MNFKTTFPHKNTCAHGFTLVELLVAVGISGVVFAVVASLTFYGGRSFAAMTNYVDMDSKSRNALDHMSREIRQADSVINYSTATLTSGPFAGKVVTNQIVLSGKEINGNNQTNYYTLTYTYDPAERELYRVKQVGPTAPKTVLLAECDYLSFGMFQRNTGNTEDDLFDAIPVNVSGTCKLVQIDWVCSRSLFGNRAHTESVQSAQVVIRKK